MLRAILDRVIVKPDAKKSESDGGITLSQSEEQFTGTVIAVGPGRENDRGDFRATSVKEGDKVLYSGHRGVPFEYEFEKYLCFAEHELSGVLHEVHQRNRR